MTAYYCSCVYAKRSPLYYFSENQPAGVSNPLRSTDYHDRFYWSWERINRAGSTIDQHTRSLLIALAQAAPDEFTGACLAAGLLEDYINLVVKQKSANEAAFIVGNRYLKPLLPDVWGDIQKLEPLAKLSKGTSRKDDLILEINLRTLSLKEVTGFWCHTCASAEKPYYHGIYQQVLGKLLGKITGEGVQRDLLRSAPDKEAEAYLKSIILTLGK